jgi:hypothetical protein
MVSPSNGVFEAPLAYEGLWVCFVCFVGVVGVVTRPLFNKPTYRCTPSPQHPPAFSLIVEIANLRYLWVGSSADCNAMTPIKRALRLKAIKLGCLAWLAGVPAALLMVAAWQQSLTTRAQLVAFTVPAAVLGVIVVGCFTVLVNPRLHHGYRRIDSYGPTALGEVNAVLAGQASAHHVDLFWASPVWLVWESRSSVCAVRSLEVVWVYSKVQTTRVNLVRVKRDHALVLVTAERQVEVPLKRQIAEKALAAAASVCPAALIGFDPSLAKLYRKQGSQAVPTIAAMAARQRPGTYANAQSSWVA